MKKIMPIISVFLVAGLITFLGFFIFRTSNIESVEIVGDIQTIYFVDSTNTVNFNESNLKVTYKDGSVKLKKLSYDLVSVKNFTTSVANDGTMKITYKSKTIDVNYSVIWTGLYFLTEKTSHTYSGGEKITSTKSGPYVAGVTETNQDKTTSIEMINFNKDGSCDYYTRSSSTGKWYMDDGYFDKSFYYTIEGNSIVANLGENKQYILKTHVTNDGELTLVTTENNYVDNQNVSFLKSSVDRTFEHYEMKGNRTISSGDIEVYSGSQKVDYDSPIVLNKNSTFDATSFDLYLKVNYKNDSFLKNVYVRFNPSMFSGLGISTAVVTPSGTSADFTYDGVNVELIYSVR